MIINNLKNNLWNQKKINHILMIFPSKIHNSVTDAIKKTELLRKINPYDALNRIKIIKPKKLYKWRKWD
jgi:hypothetical protein